jgi:hypothetical protein
LDPVGRFDRALRHRLLPAILTATGVSLIASGLLTYTGAAELTPQPSPTSVAAVPTPTFALPTFSTSSGSPSTSSPTPDVDHVATRIRIPGLDIDLPVIAQPNPKYPSCDVAMYHDWFGQPGDVVGPYIYAHAREGMFLPILKASRQNKGNAMLGMSVSVYTDDGQVFFYDIVEVRRHVPASFNLLDLYDDGIGLLWLQTSEGSGKEFPKLQIKAVPLTVGTATHAEANPVAKPVDC